MCLQRWDGWCHMKLLPSWRVLCTTYNHAPCHVKQSHICKVYACLAVTCQLHFWQNDRDLLRAAAVTRGWNGYQNSNQHIKLTLEKKILSPLLQGLEPATPPSLWQLYLHDTPSLDGNYFNFTTPSIFVATLSSRHPQS